MSKNLLIQNCVPVGNGHDGKTFTSIRIKDGIITNISDSLEKGDDEELFDAGGAFVSGGWMDMHVHLREPGFEHKETIETGCRAAAFGGFTEVACMPNTKPAIHTSDVVEYIRKRAEGEAVSVHPIGCVTKDRAGKSIAEMADMKKAVPLRLAMMVIRSIIRR